MRHLLKYATSKDGLVWTRKGLLKGLDESGIYAQSRPSMVKIGNRYHVWYCKRGSEYVLGHAEGNTIQNVKANHRLAKVLFDENSKEFEPTVSYPYAFRHKQNLYLLYCGENYGRGGFKLAQLKNIV